MVCSVFLVKLRRIIIIAKLDGPVYFEKFYGTCIYIYIYIYIYLFYSMFIFTIFIQEKATSCPMYIYLFYSMFIFSLFVQENVTSCPICDLCPFILKTRRGSCR